MMLIFLAVGILDAICAHQFLKNFLTLMHLYDQRKSREHISEYETAMIYASASLIFIILSIYIPAIFWNP